MCGIIGVISEKNVANEIYLGLLATKNRGTNSSGILTYNEKNNKFYRKTGAYSIDRVFMDLDFSNLEGKMGLGHNRYATTASKDELKRDAQPVFTKRPGIAMSFNGHLESEELKNRQIEEGWTFHTNCDVEFLLHSMAQRLIENKAHKIKDSETFAYEKLFPTLEKVMEEMDEYGSYSVITILDGRGILAYKDPHGVRPLAFAKKRDYKCYAFASETTGINLMGGYHEIRELERGEAIFIDTNFNVYKKIIKQSRPAFCSFEQVYFSEIESDLLGEKVFITRQKLGEALSKTFGYLSDKVDRIVAVPRTPEVAAIKLARCWNKDYGGIVKRGGIDIRTFLEPTQELRERASEMKYLYIKPLIEGKRIGIVDDSIVRGTASKNIIKNLRALGVKEVHFFSTYPPIQHSCKYGIDTPTKQELIAARVGGNIKKITKELDADTVNYLPLETLVQILGAPLDHFCTSCVTGKYLKDEKQ